jgi:hypothetical protein
MKLKKVLLVLLLFMLPIALPGCAGVYIQPGDDYFYQLPGNYVLQSVGNNACTTIYHPVRGPVTDGVTGIAWNDQTILASSLQNDEPGYWIIDTKSATVLGPLSEADFSKKRDELKIDSTLKLEKPEKYRCLDPSSSMMNH